jgi:histidinol-phosphate aminotransferase
VLDGAYVEYVEGYDGGAALVEDARQRRDDAHLLQGLRARRVRVGYGAMRRGHVIEVLNRIRGPFNLSTIALGGGGGVRDTDWVERSCASMPMSARG